MAILLLSLTSAPVVFLLTQTGILHPSSTVLSSCFLLLSPNPLHHETYGPTHYKIMATRQRKPTNGEAVAGEDLLIASTSSTSSSAVLGLLTTAASPGDREEVKVNNASATEMKHACDDALKRVSVSYLVCLRLALAVFRWVMLSSICSVYGGGLFGSHTISLLLILCSWGERTSSVAASRAHARGIQLVCPRSYFMRKHPLFIYRST